MFVRSTLALVLAVAGIAAAQDAVTEAPASAPQLQPPPAPPAEYVVKPGTMVPLTLINSISTKHNLEGDPVYLETSFPILVNGKIVIPVGSYVAGTVTQLKKPGRAKGRGEIYVRFDSLTLPNGVTRDFRARIGGIDGTTAGELDRSEGTVKSEGNKAGDMRTLGEAAGSGASVGGIAGSISGHAAMGVGIGAAAGAAAGLIAILATRGPDAVLAKGSTVEMVLDRPISFSAGETDFGNYQPPRAAPGPQPQSTKSVGIPRPGRGGIIP